MSMPSQFITHQSRPSFKFFFRPPDERILKRSSVSKPYRLTSTSSGRFDTVFKKNRVLGQRKMLKATALRSSSASDNEGIQAFEQEAFISNSSGLMGDGLESTLNRLSKWLVLVLFGAFILWRHDAESLWAAMGSIVNAMLSVALKQILNQERPFSTVRSDPGMPSSHSQSIFFMVVVAISSIIEWLGVYAFTMIFSVAVLALGSYFSWLRVSQQLHTISQVVVGALLGAGFSSLWYWSWEAFVLEAYNSLLWVRIIVILGAVGFCVGFLVYVIRHWFRDDR